MGRKLEGNIKEMEEDRMKMVVGNIQMVKCERKNVFVGLTKLEAKNLNENRMRYRKEK
jgi:hypothetical protein